MVEVRWFRNSHEHRNYWLRFGLMRLHRQRQVVFTELPLAVCRDFGFPEEVAGHEHRHTSVIVVSDQTRSVRCIVDSEDSFFHLTHLLKCADVYFCAGYNSAFFKERTFKPPYAWLEPQEVARYSREADRLAAEFSGWFNRVRPFVPIGPELAMPRPVRLPLLSRKIRGLHHRLDKRLGAGMSWRYDLQDFEQRYAYLLNLRQAPLLHDVVLLDTLWGWPRHREALHRRLGELSGSHRIHARLNWRPGNDWDGSSLNPTPEVSYPIMSGHVDDYERMLASSRLGCFATGFHFGWRNIMTLALMWGLPVLSDRLLLEPWFDVGRFRILWNDDVDWRELAQALSGITEDDWRDTKTHNQKAFDDVLAPERVADYFLRVALEGGLGA